MPRRGCCLVLAVLSACSAERWARSHDDDSGRPPPAAFLQRRPASYGDALAELGAPHREFRRDQVAMWELAIDGERCVPAARRTPPARAADYMLVVEFGPERQVVRWSLLAQLVRR